MVLEVITYSTINSLRWNKSLNEDISISDCICTTVDITILYLILENILAHVGGEKQLCMVLVQELEFCDF